MSCLDVFVCSNYCSFIGLLTVCSLIDCVVRWLMHNWLDILFVLIDCAVGGVLIVCLLLCWGRLVVSTIG